MSRICVNRWLLHGIVLLVVLFASAQVARASTDDEQPVASDGYFATVRLTYYVESGLTFGGGHTYYGSTACSWNFPLGTQFELPGGEQFICNDRGRLGSSGWLDLWRRSDLARLYGDWVIVRVF